MMKYLIAFCLVISLVITSSAQSSGRMLSGDPDYVQDKIVYHGLTLQLDSFTVAINEYLKQNPAPASIRMQYVGYNCNLEGGECEARYTLFVNGTQKHVMGSKGVMGHTGGYNPSTRIHDGSKLERPFADNLGSFKLGGQVKIKFDVWEDDAGDDWKKDSNWGISDDDYADVEGTVTIDTVKESMLTCDANSIMISRKAVIGTCPEIAITFAQTIPYPPSCSKAIYDFILGEMAALEKKWGQAPR